MTCAECVAPAIVLDYQQSGNGKWQSIPHCAAHARQSLPMTGPCDDGEHARCGGYAFAPWNVTGKCYCSCHTTKEAAHGTTQEAG